MKLMRFGDKGAEKPGVIIEGVPRDCSQHFEDWNHDFFATDGLRKLAQLITTATLPPVPSGMRWAACIARPYKIMAIGLNYHDHAAEVGAPVPTEPLMFFKASNITAGAYDDFYFPPNAHCLDWEVELGIIIAKDVLNIGSDLEAEQAIAGYTVVNDITERHWQFERQGQWSKGKSFLGFCTVGPYLLTTDELKVNQLAMSLTINGQLRQSSSTANMIFSPIKLVRYLSQFMQLEAGDLICSGTPAGIGYAAKPQQFLQPGDVMSAAIDSLGEQKQRCFACP